MMAIFLKLPSSLRAQAQIRKISKLIKKVSCWLKLIKNGRGKSHETKSLASERRYICLLEHKTKMIQVCLATQKE